MTPRFIAFPFIALLCACGQQQAANTTGQPADSAAIQSSSSDRTVSPSQLIVPGHSVGHTYLNESTAAVEKRLGLADEGDAAMGKSLYTWYNRHDTTGFQTSIYSETKMGVDDTSRVKQIRITSPWFMTSEGLGVNASLKNIIAAGYLVTKAASFVEHTHKVDLYDTDKGIAFEIGAENELCSGIIIHEVSRPVSATYLPFHPGAQKNCLSLK